MPWRLIQFIVLFAIFLIFVILNTTNKCDIRFGTEKMILKDVPVFLTVFVSFMAGMLCTLPFVFGSRLRKKEKIIKGKGLLAKASDKLENSAKSTPKVPDKPEDPHFDSRNYGID